MSCCKKIIDLGIIGSCENLTLPIIATSSGEYTVDVYWLNSITSFTIDVTLGEAIVINTQMMNESALLSFVVKDENGDLIGIDNGCGVVTDFIVQTKLKLNYV